MHGWAKLPLFLNPSCWIMKCTANVSQRYLISLGWCFVIQAVADLLLFSFLIEHFTLAISPN